MRSIFKQLPHKNTPPLHQRVVTRPALLMALEPRIMFDAALGATVAEAASHVATLRSIDAAHALDHPATAPPPSPTPTPAPATPHAEVVFISDQVDDAQTLLGALRPNMDVVVLDSARDGLAQIADYLAGHTGVEAVHIVSHGMEGSVELGNLWLNGQNLSAHADTLARIGDSLAPGADLLFYGCNVGAGADGAAFVSQLSEAIGADVAASNNMTGATRFGGDWELEVHGGMITASMAFEAPALASYSGLLAIADENFDSAGLIYQPAATSVVVGTWTFTSTGASDLATPNSGDQAFNLNSDGGVNDRNFVWNLGGAAVSTFGLKSTDGTNFTLNSFKLGSAGGSTSVTVTGWRDGAQVVSGETVDLTASDSAGNITYSFTGTTPGGSYGALTFGSAFSNVDEIRFVFGSATTAEIDDIDISAVDTTPPTASVVVADSSLTVGETSLVTITFSEAVTGFTNADLTIANGTLSAVSSSDGGTTWTATLTPTANLKNATNLITLNNTGVTDTAGNAGIGTTNSNNYAIDTQRPTAGIVVADNSLTIGETSLVTITFSESVTFFTNADLTIANGTLSAVSSSDGGITWTATLTPTASLTDATNLITLNNAGVTDIAGNAGTGTTDSNNYAIDTQRPTAGIVVADTALAVGETSLVTITFSEAVTSFTNADLAIANGTLSAVSSSDGGTTWTATLTPAASVTDATNLITLDNTGVTDIAGNAGTGTTNSNNYAIDTQRPTAGIVVADNALAIGETSLVTITFSEAVTGFTNADLTIANGTLSAISSSDGGITWTASLTPTASVTDATNLITLDNTGVTDAAGNAGTGTTDSNNYAIDTQRPTAGIVVADNSLIIGETSLVTITFSEAVTGFTNADLTIANGTLSAVSSSDGGITWTATLTPTASVTDTTNLITLDNTGVTDIAGNTGTGTTDSNNYAIDTQRPTAGIVVADTALAVGETSLVTITFSEAVTSFTNADLTIANGTLSAVSSSDGGITWTATLTPTASVTDTTNLITLDNTGVTDIAGNTGTGTTDSNNYAIDTQRPTAGIVVADTALAVGETSLVTITFSEAVTGFTNADLTIANGTLSAVSSSDGGTTWTATLTPTASVTDATNLITLDNTGITDTAGNTGTGTTDSNNYALDTQRPTAGIVVADTALAVGETSLVTITFSEAVTGFTNADLTIANGTLSAVSSSDGGITWTATLTPTASVTDATNLITLDNTGVADAAGNAGTGTTDSNNYAIDTQRPTAGIVVADNALAIGETSLVTITFSEAVTGFTNADLTIANGTLSAVSSSDGGITWTATLTPTASITDATNLLTLDNTGVTDAAGNAGTGTTNSNNYAIDTQRPTAGIVVADTALAAGETSLVTITFSEAVTGFTNADLTVANGTLSAVSSSDGGTTWTATLTPTASVTDATNLITLDNTGVMDTAGNAGTGTTDSNNYAIDTARPTAGIVVTDTALAVGETSLVTITFSEAVTGFTNADLTIANGTLSAVSSSDGGITWTATLTPTASVTDATNLITLDNTGVTDTAGNAGTGTTDSNNYALDTARPTAGIVVADNALAIGETSLVTITFSEAVTGFTNADLTIANGTLSAVSSSDGGITWTATLTPTASVTDATNLITLDNTGVADAAGNIGTGTTDSNNYAIDTQRPTAGIVVADTALVSGETSLVTITFSEAVTGFTNADLTIANGTLSAVSSSDGGITWTATLTPTAAVADTTNLITLDNTGVMDTAGNVGTGTTDSNNYAIDTSRPTAGIVVADNALSIGETSLVTITFSEAVTGFTNADLTIANGTLSAVSSSDGGITWTATLTPTASMTDATNLITLDNTGVTNAAGNAGIGTTASNNYAIDTARPNANIVVTDTALAAGDTSLVTITFSEAVTGFTNADLTIAHGTLSNVASLDGGLTWTATFTPELGFTQAGNTLTLSNAGVQDMAGNAGTGTTVSNAYGIDTLVPTVSTVTVPANGSHTAGENLDFTVHFSEAINVDASSGAPRIAVTLDTGGIVYANYLSGSGSTDLVFRLTVSAGQEDATGITLGASIDSHGGHLRDAIGNEAITVLHGVASTADVLVDAIEPTVAGIALPPDGYYHTGDVLTFTVSASEAVSVNTTNGVPRLALDMNGTTVYAAYVSGSGSGALVFQYTVQAGDNAANGIAVAALEPHGAVLADRAGNSLDLTLPNVGALVGLIIDTTAPTVSSIVRLDPTPTSADSVRYQVSFTEAVSGVDASDFTLVKDAAARGSIVSVTPIDTRTYLVLVGGVSGSGQIGLTLNDTQTGISDAAGNTLGRGFIGSQYDIQAVVTPAPASPPIVVDMPVVSAPPLPEPVIPVTLSPLAMLISVNTPTLAPPLPVGTAFTLASAEPTLSMGGVSLEPSVPLGSGLMPQVAARTGFVDAGSAVGPGLRAIPDIGDFAVNAGMPISIGLPAATFTHGDRNAELVFEVRLADGRPLPGWLKFDPTTGTLSGQPPRGMSQKLVIEIIGRDNQGGRARSQLDLNVRDAGPPASPPAVPPRPAALAEPRGQWASLVNHLDADASLPVHAALLPAGRPALETQFEQHGLAAQRAQAAALLDHLRAATRGAG